MSNFNNLKEIQYKKIAYFCSKVKIENIHTAERYLNEAMWDEKLAVQNYFIKHNNMNIDIINFNKNKIKENENNQNNIFQKPDPIVKNDVKNDINNIEKIEIINENDENYIPLKITNVIDEHKYNNSPTCESLNYIKNNLETVKLEFNYFLELTKNRIGIILIYKEDIFNMVLKDKIKEIKRHVLYSVLNDNYVIFPVLNNSPIGKELSRQFLCISYPSCLFCEYKKKGQLCVTKRMDGAFDVPFFYNCIPFENKKIHANTSRNKIENDNNINIINKINNFINKKRDYNDNYNYENPNINNMENNQINNNLKDMNQKIEINNINKNNNIGDNKDFEDMKKSENNENIKHNYKKYNSQNFYQNNLDNYYMGSNTGFFELIKKISNEQEDNPNNRKNDNNNLNNNSNYNEMNNKNPYQNEMNNQNKNFNKNNNDKYDNNNNNLFINNNENNNYNNNKYNNNYNPFINKEENSNKNINQNYNNKYENYDQSINKNENLKKIFNNNKKFENKEPFENENLDKTHNIMADSIFGLSDGQILAKREREIKELERQQLEKEEKEEEERKKVLEEEKRIKKLKNKYIYEAKIVKMILSDEPKEDNPEACHIKFRHPDGEKIIERRFLKTDKIASLYDYVKSIGREIFTEEDAFDFELIGGFPPKSLEDKKSNTLEEEGMFPNFILQIKEK